MHKLLQYLDNHILKWAVIATSLFVALYPKLPSIHITYTWVYIRLEDFAIAGLVVLWIVQLLRRKVRLALPVGIPIVFYWLAGLASLMFSLLYIGPHLANFFPKIAALEYFRRIEYMILFFVGYSAVQSKEDLRDFVKFLFLGVGAIVVYGFAQHFYPYFWKYLPEAIQKTNFCFPSFQTGNEEFAKGIPLCLPVGSRVTSTFGGHYDLAAYLLITLPIVLGSWFVVKKRMIKVVLGVLYLAGVIILILTASRIAFGAYLFAVIPPLILLKKKKWILPVIALSFVCLLLFSESTIHRFAQTFRITSVVVNMQGQVVGTTESGLTAAQQKQLAQGNKAIQGNEVVQGEVPEGSSFITLPQQKIATNTAVVKQGLSTKEAQKLKLANGGLEISKVQGNFSVQKALVYDISVTTRLQGEWPHAIASLLSSPILGTGYSTLTLAVDNDYLRLLGESGILGFATFISIFVILSIFLKQVLPSVKDDLTKVFVYGLIGGVVGLFVNAALFDIFEASKVAEPLWLFLGVGVGAVALNQKKKVKYLESFIRVGTSKVFLFAYLFVMIFAVFWASLQQFFIGDDFVWLKWAATSTFADVPKYFTDAGGFFYRPIDKLLMLLFYSVFSFQPQGYHVIILLLHGLMAVGVYLLTRQLLKSKVWAFVAAILFALLPMHEENIFWISALSIDLSSVCILFAIVLFLQSKLVNAWKSWFAYTSALILAALALMSYELALVLPLLLFIVDWLIAKKVSRKSFVLYVPFVLLDMFYLVARTFSHALSSGGDYAYNLYHFIPNVIGNSIGYIGLFIFGPWSLSFYTQLRVSTKHFALPIGLLILFGVVCLLYVSKKIPLWKIIKAHNIVLFGFCWSIITLLPYLGLGNIAERYGYLASVGFVIGIVWLVQQIFARNIVTKKGKIVIGIILAAIVFSWSIVGLEKEQQDWATAARVSYNTLGYFKIEDGVIDPNSTFILVDRPIRYANAWIFPVGLPEGLWFVYGDTTPQVIDASSLIQAKQMAAKKPHSSLFIFGEKYQIKHVQ